MAKEGKKIFCRVAKSTTQVEDAAQLPILIDDPAYTRYSKESSSNISLQRNQEVRKRNHLSYSIGNDHVTHAATNFGKNSASTLPYKYLLAVIDDDDEGEAVVWPTTLLTSTATINKEILVQEDAEPISYRNSRILLGEAFGTKKTKSILSSYERNKIDLDQLQASSSKFIGKTLGDNMMANNKSDNVTQNDRLQPAKDASETMSFLPAHDSLTTNVRDIYKLKDIVPLPILESMDTKMFVESADSASLKRAFDEYLIQETLRGHFASILLSTQPRSEEKFIDRVRLLAYLNTVLLFRGLSEAKVNSPNLAKLIGGTPSLHAHLRENYCEQVKLPSGKLRWKQTATLKDKLIVHICLLLLIASDYRLNVAEFSAMLRLPLTKCSEYCKVVGCVLERPVSGEPSKYKIGDRQISVKFASLKAPLNIQATTKSGGNKRTR